MYDWDGLLMELRHVPPGADPNDPDVKAGQAVAHRVTLQCYGYGATKPRPWGFRGPFPKPDQQGI